MKTRIPSYDLLAAFAKISKYPSFSAAADALFMSKGAISQQIAKLESDLGFNVFIRTGRGIDLTHKGHRLLRACVGSFASIDDVVKELQVASRTTLTIGMSTYFASRWLSSRLMSFTSDHADIVLRIQPTMGPIDLHLHDIDMLIRWGNGHWQDLTIEPLLMCPAKPYGNKSIYALVVEQGIDKVLKSTTLLHDFEGSVAWQHWHSAAGLKYEALHDNLVIVDPTVRVQAVIDGQGVALNDQLVTMEVRNEQLFELSDVSLDNYGYFLAYPQNALDNPTLLAFRDWIMQQVPDS